MILAEDLNDNPHFSRPATTNRSAGNLSPSGSTATLFAMSDDDDDEISLSSTNKTSMENRENCDLLEQHLKTCDVTKSSCVAINNERFVFQHNNLNIFVSIRNNKSGKAIDISCNVHKKQDPLLDCRPTSYSLMTKMMKYKSIFQYNTKRQQIGIWDGKFLYIRSLSLSLLEKHNLDKLSSELEDFCSIAEKMANDFSQEALYFNVSKGLEQFKSRKTGRSRSCC
mmetsp:Transcript_27499/g.41620  ORF Transcript_27499/g.41620 Transcript_27499/m.41620 type:complete len:225 (+) Transcript_27499:100-774(+)